MGMNIHFYVGPMLVGSKPKFLGPFSGVDAEELAMVLGHKGEPMHIWLPNKAMDREEHFIFYRDHHGESGHLDITYVDVMLEAVTRFKGHFEKAIKEVTDRYGKADVCYGAVAYYM